MNYEDPSYLAISHKEFATLNQAGGKITRRVEMSNSMRIAEQDAVHCSGDHPEKKAIILKLDTTRLVEAHGEPHEFRHGRHADHESSFVFLTHELVKFWHYITGWYVTDCSNPPEDNDDPAY